MQVFTLLSTFFKGNLNFHTQCSKFLPQILIFKSGGVLLLTKITEKPEKNLFFIKNILK